MRSIHPQNFITIASIVLEICTGQNSSMKKKKNRAITQQELPSLLQSYELQGKQPFVSDCSHLLRHAIEKGRGPILYSKKKNPGPHGENLSLKNNKEQ